MKTIKKYSLSLHDLRVSWNEETVKKIKYVMDLFEVPLTVHLVFDIPLSQDSVLSDFILQNLKDQKIEIVFHGLTHKCSREVSKLLAFYHKYQAEYLDDSDELREKTQKMLYNTIYFLRMNIGICPPCWIAHKKNTYFFKTLKPLYIESLLSIFYSGTKIFSPVISLGSPNKCELYFLKILARSIHILSIISGNSNLRVAIHDCDLDKKNSIKFFSGIIGSFKARKFQPVLLKNLD